MRKKFFWVLGCLILVLTLGLYGYRYYQDNYTVEPVPLVEEALTQARQAESYSYTVAAFFSLEGKNQEWSQIEGLKSGSDFHIKGKILGTLVEIYQIAEKVYSYNPTSKKWVVLEDTNISQGKMQMAEINPLNNLSFTSMGEVRLLGLKNVDEKKCWVVEFSPKVADNYLALWWKNFTYRLWIERGSSKLIKAIVTAENKNSPGTKLTLQVDFQNYGKKIKLQPPSK